MEEVDNILTLKEILGLEPAVLVYFYNDTCAPCVALRPKVAEMASSNFPKLRLIFCNALRMAEAASEYGIFASPTLLVFFEGRETIRESKYISINGLHDAIQRYYNLIFND